MIQNFIKKNHLDWQRPFKLRWVRQQATVASRDRKIQDSFLKNLYGLWSGGVIGLYFFENETVTVNESRYPEMIHNFYGRNWTVLAWMTFTFNKFLRKKFLNRVISRRGDRNWLPTSCDLRPCDVKSTLTVQRRFNASKMKFVKLL